MPNSESSTQSDATRSGSILDFFLILALFFSSRLMLLLAFPPEDLITYGDFSYYFTLADFSREGFFPYIDYWQEYPPIFPYLNLVIYTVAGQELKNYIFLLSVVFLVIDCGNLYLLYRLALTLRGRNRALQLAWIYTALFVPVFFISRNFDSLTAFFILLGLYGLLKQKSILIALGLGLGAMVKVLPIMLVGTIWRRNGLKSAMLIGGVALLISLLIFGPFFFINPAMATASLVAQPGKSSYETVWALLDGNDETGNFGPLADHFDSTKAAEPLNNPARIPSWLTFIPFGLVGLFILSRPRLLHKADTDAVIFTALTFVIFFLWSPGWSPQWQTFLIPLLLLALPERRAVLFVIVLGFVNFLEWPVILSRGLTQLLPITVLIRTFLFVILAIELYRLLPQPDRHVPKEKFG